MTSSFGAAAAAKAAEAAAARPVANPMQLIEDPTVVRQRMSEARTLVGRMRAEARAREERRRMVAAAESDLLTAELAVLDAGRHDKERAVEAERLAAIERRKEAARVSRCSCWCSCSCCA